MCKLQRQRMTITFRSAIIAALLLPCAEPERLRQKDEGRVFPSEDVLSKFREGWEAASRLVGIDTAQGVASLVSANLSPSVHKQDVGENPTFGLFTGFFKLFGLDSSKLGAIAVNAIIFIAQLIGTSFIKKTTVEMSRNRNEEPLKQEQDEDPLKWILLNPSQKAKYLISAAQDKNLPEQVIESLQSAPGSTSCIQLLVCKITPFLLEMQRSIQVYLNPTSKDQEQWDSLTPLQRMYTYLPTVAEIRDNSLSCEVRFPHCRILHS